MGKVLVRIMIAVVVLGGAAVWKLTQRGESAREAHDVIKKMIVAMPQYTEDRQNLDNWLETAHRAASDAAYSSDGTFSRATFDGEKYGEVLFEKMITLAKAANKDKLATAIDELQVRYINEFLK